METKKIDMTVAAEATGKAVKSFLGKLGGSGETTGLYRSALRQVEEPLIYEVLKSTGGNQSQAALKLGMNRATLRDKMKYLDIPSDKAHYL